MKINPNNKEIFFTSDTHFGHKLMTTMRPFGSVEEMDESLIENWNRDVSKDAVVFHLGDFIFSVKTERIKSLIKRLNGKIILVKGNHDSKLRKNHLECFHEVYDYLELNINKDNIHITLCHYPFAHWNRSHYGAWNLHGHCHGNNLISRENQLDVGVDCHNFRPISFEEVKNLIK